MKKIPLTQVQEVLVDDADYEWLSQWKWTAHKGGRGGSYYAVRNEVLPNGKRRFIAMHRQILGLAHGDKRQGDHKNHNGLDNQRANLRIVTNQQNQWNQKSRRGYFWNSRVGKFQSIISLSSGRQKHLGFYDDPEIARRAYLDAKAIHHVIG